MVFHSRFRVRADLASVRRFHQSTASLPAITPPPVAVRDVEAPDELTDGDDMRFTLRIGPLSVRWHARIEDVADDGFTDRQVSGPFAEWRHRHDFVAIAPAVTEVRDTIRIRMSRRPADALVALPMIVGLPVLFRYRAHRTRRLLEGPRGL